MATSVKEALEKGPEFGVLADQHDTTVRLWTLSQPFIDGRVLRSLKKFFPDLQVNGKIIRLGGYQSLAKAHEPLANAKTFSKSKKIQALYRFDTEESLATIKNVA